MSVTVPGCFSIGLLLSHVPWSIAIDCACNPEIADIVEAPLRALLADPPVGKLCTKSGSCTISESMLKPAYRRADADRHTAGCYASSLDRHLYCAFYRPSEEGCSTTNVTTAGSKEVEVETCYCNTSNCNVIYPGRMRESAKWIRCACDKELHPGFSPFVTSDEVPCEDGECYLIDDASTAMPACLEMQLDYASHRACGYWHNSEPTCNNVSDVKICRCITDRCNVAVAMRDEIWMLLVFFGFLYL